MFRRFHLIVKLDEGWHVTQSEKLTQPSKSVPVAAAWCGPWHQNNGQPLSGSCTHSDTHASYPEGDTRRKKHISRCLSVGQSDCTEARMFKRCRVCVCVCVGIVWEGVELKGLFLQEPHVLWMTGDCCVSVNVAHFWQWPPVATLGPGDLYFPWWSPACFSREAHLRNPATSPLAALHSSHHHHHHPNLPAFPSRLSYKSQAVPLALLHISSQ